MFCDSHFRRSLIEMAPGDTTVGSGPSCCRRLPVRHNAPADRCPRLLVPAAPLSTASRIRAPGVRRPPNHDTISDDPRSRIRISDRPGDDTIAEAAPLALTLDCPACHADVFIQEFVRPPA